MVQVTKRVRLPRIPGRIFNHRKNYMTHDEQEVYCFASIASHRIVRAVLIARSFDPDLRHRRPGDDPKVPTNQQEEALEVGRDRQERPGSCVSTRAPRIHCHAPVSQGGVRSLPPLPACLAALLAGN